MQDGSLAIDLLPLVYKLCDAQAAARLELFTGCSTARAIMSFLKSFLTPSKKPAVPQDPLVLFIQDWQVVKAILSRDASQQRKHVNATDLPRRFQSMADLLASESRRVDEGDAGPLLEHTFKSDILGQLVRACSTDDMEGLKTEVIRFFAALVVLLDEQFLAHSAVHKPLLKLLHDCIQPDGTEGQPTLSTDYEVDLVDLLSFVANRIRSYPELLPIFFHNRKAGRRGPGKAAARESIEQRILQAGQGAKNGDGRLSPGPSEGSTGSTAPAGIPRATSPGEYEFLVFFYLLRYIHREGRIGDLARAGLLFLVDVAMSAGLHPFATEPSPDLADATLALAEFLLDSDFAEVLAAGMGALYGLLPSKLAVRTAGPAADGQAALGSMSSSADLAELEREEDRLTAQGVGLSTSGEVQDTLALLLKLVAFAQDVLQRAPVHDAVPALLRSTSSAASTSSSIPLVGACMTDNILTAIRDIFLESVLYPSLLECSDQDGSGVAVLTYLDALLSNIVGGSALASTALDFLSAGSGGDEQEQSTLRGTKRAAPEPRVNKRKSNALLLVEGLRGNKRDGDAVYSSLGRYTLRDLLLLHLKSTSQPSKAAALRLLATLQAEHAGFALQLLDVKPPPEDDQMSDDSDEEFVYPGSSSSKPAPENTIDMSALLLRHNAEMGNLLAVLVMIDPSASRDEVSGLSRYAQDAQAAVAAHDASSGQADLDVSQSVLRAVLDLMPSLFDQPVDVNLALTGVLASLASCPTYKLDGWLTPLTTASAATPTKVSADAAPRHDDGDDRSIDHIVEDRNRLGLLPSAAAIAPRWGSSRSSSVVFGMLEKLAEQVAGATDRVGNFDALLVERRSSLLFVDTLADALVEPEAGAMPDYLSPEQPRPAKFAGGSIVNPYAAHYAETAAQPAPIGQGTLSVFLDNVVVLEEAVKELVAVIQCRRAFGIDPL